MDTVKVTLTKDTIVTANVKTITQKTFVETIEPKNCWHKICDCKIISDLVWPLTILIILIILLLFYKRIKYIFDRFSIESIEAGGVKLKFKDLFRGIEKVENSMDKEVATIIVGDQKQDDFDYNISNDLHTEILRISNEIEKTLRTIKTLKTGRTGPFSVPELIESLHQEKAIDLEVTKLLRQFWMFRNGIVHSISYNVSENEFLAFADVGFRVLRILKQIQNKIEVESNIIIKSAKKDLTDGDLQDQISL